MHRAEVVQFEISGADSAALRSFYGRLFGWQIHEVYEPSETTYGIVTHGDGVRGRIRASAANGPGGVTPYVEVDDVLEHLVYAEELGGTILRLPYEVTLQGKSATLALFSDPAGNTVGLSRGLHYDRVHAGMKDSQSGHVDDPLEGKAAA